MVGSDLGRLQTDVPKGPQTGAILCAGRAYCDLLFADLPNWPKPGQEVFAGGLGMEPGGGAINTAAALKALGLTPWLFSILPASPFDTLILSKLRSCGINMHHVGYAPEGSDPQITVALPSPEDRAFVTRKSGRAVPDLSTFPKIGLRHVHISELATLVEHPDLIPMARDCGCTLSVDCGWDSDLLGKGADMASLIDQIDVFLPNDVEWEALQSSGLPEDCCELTVVKSGKDGAHARTGGHWTHMPTKSTPIVNATGAGDAFNGGFLSKWLDFAPLEACLHQGNLCGAQAVQQMGGMLQSGAAHIEDLQSAESSSMQG